MSRLVGSRVLLASCVCVLATSFVSPVESTSASAWWASNLSPALTKISAWSRSLFSGGASSNGEGPTYVVDEASLAPPIAPAETDNLVLVALTQRGAAAHAARPSNFSNPAPLPKPKPASENASAITLASLNPHTIPLPPAKPALPGPTRSESETIPLPPVRPPFSSASQSASERVPLPPEKPAMLEISHSAPASAKRDDTKTVYASLSTSDSAPVLARAPAAPVMNAPTAVERPIEPAAAVIAPTPSPGKAERVEASLGGGISAAAPAALPIARDEMSRPEPAFSRSEGAKEFPAPKEFPAALERHASLGPSSSDAKFDAAYVPPEKMRVAYDAPPPMERPKSI